MAEPLDLPLRSKPPLSLVPEIYSNESQKSDIVTTNQIKLDKMLRKSLGIYPDTEQHVNKFLFIVFCLQYIYQGLLPSASEVQTNMKMTSLSLYVKQNKQMKP